MRAFILYTLRQRERVFTMATAAFAKSREALFRAVFELSREAIFVLDRSGYLECNQAGLDMFGLSNQQQLKAIKIGDASPPFQPDGRESRVAAMEHIEAAYRGERQFYEWQNKRLDGTLFFTDISLSRIEIAGKPYLHAILHDISERKRTEEELRKSRELLARVVDASSDGFWDLHVPTRKITLSDRWFTMLGYEVNEFNVTSESFLNLMHPKDRERSWNARNACINGETPGYRAEFRLRAKSGEWHWILARGKVSSWIAPGQAEWLSGTHVDIHAHKRAEQMLAMQYAVTEIITAADEFLPAMKKILGTLCEALECCVGSLYLLSPDRSQLKCACVWHDPGVVLDDFLEVSSKVRFSRGDSLPGQVWESGQPSWIPIEPNNPVYPRAPAAAKAGLQTGMGFPLRIGDEIAGVIDFFSRELRQPEDVLRSTLARIGEQIAQFQRHKQAEKHLLDLNADLEARVAERTLELQRHRESLESVVGQRTAELHENNVRLSAEIVDRKRSEAELRKLSWAVENSPTMVLITDVLGCIEYVNPRFVQVTGYAESEVMGRNPRILKSNTHPADFYETLWQTLCAGKTWRGELLNKRKNGQLYWQATTISPIRNSQGTITHFVAVMEDITARRRAEEEMQRARDAAESANRAKSEFLANISHEIRTPMNAIIGLNHLFKTTKLNGRQRNFVVNIEAAAQSLMEVINDILDFSQVESGKIELQYVEFTLDAVMSKLAHVTSLQAQQKSLDFTINVAPDIPPVLVGDPLRLGQVLLNLTSNAIKFTKKGRICVSAERGRTEDKSVELRFTVSDTGIGIDEKLRARLFAPFEQADNSTTRRYGGTGLGLVISKRFVELMNGTIDVQSKAGAGTTVVFTVRMADAGKKAWQVQPQLPQMVGRRALVADENETSRAALQNLLTGFSFDVVCVLSGAGLADEIQRTAEAGTQGYDLIFLSEALTGVSWRDAVAQIRTKNCAAKRPAIVLVASLYSDALRASAESLRLEGFLLKPFTRSTLYDVMLHALSSAAQSDPPSTSELAAVDARQALRGTRILLVEDNEINQLVAVEILRLAGSEVTVASGGAESLAKLAQPNSHALFDLVLMDLQMPEMDGFEATRRIRLDPRLSRIPILAMTADVVQGVREKCLAAGMNDYLSKPIKPEELYGKVASWVHAGKQPPADRHLSRRPTGTVPKPPSPAAVTKSGRHAALSKKNPFIDAEAGIARVAGNCELYERLLKQFYDKYRHAADDIDEALKRGQRDDAVRIAHTVKGVSGNLGVTPLHKAAIDWERCLKEFAESDKPVREHFRAVLTDSMAAIAKLLPSPEPRTQPPPSQPRAAASKPATAISRQTKASLAKLASMLESNDLDAPALAKALAEQLQGHGVDDELGDMRNNMQRFDFVSSLSILKKIMLRLEIAPESV